MTLYTRFIRLTLLRSSPRWFLESNHPYIINQLFRISFFILRLRVVLFFFGLLLSRQWCYIKFRDCFKYGFLRSIIDCSMSHCHCIDAEFVRNIDGIFEQALLRLYTISLECVFIERVHFCTLFFKEKTRDKCKNIFIFLFIRIRFDHFKTCHYK